MPANSPEGKIEYTPEHKEVRKSDNSSGQSKTQQTVQQTKVEIAKTLSK